MMSTIICLGEAGRVILATDSRAMTSDFADVYSDTTEKIIELGPRTFLATMGWTTVCDFQARRARELAGNTTDIRGLAKLLDQESEAVLWELVKILSGFTSRCAEVEAALSGRLPLHRFVLAGYSGGQLGWLCHNYYLRNGQIEVTEKERFDAGRSLYVADGESLRHLAQDPATWRDEPLVVVERFLAEARRVDPCVGGANQIVVLDAHGVHWVSRLATADTATAGCIAASSIRASDGVFETAAIQDADIGNLSVSKITAGNLTAAVTVTGSLTIIKGSTTITLEPVYGLKVIDSVAGNISVFDDGYLTITRVYDQAIVSPTGISCGTSSYYSWIGGGVGVFITAAGTTRIDGPYIKAGTDIVVYGKSCYFNDYYRGYPGSKFMDTSGNATLGTLKVTSIPVYANNAAAVAGGLTAGAFYRTGGDPDAVCVVH